MKSPKHFIRSILSPIYQFHIKYTNKDAIKGYTTSFANFIYEHSQDVATMMLLGFAVSSISSHIAQINGLKKSKRENKEFLIKQEESELKLDLLFTILPPFFIKEVIKDKLHPAKYITKSSLDLLRKEVPWLIGITDKDLFYIEPKEPWQDVLKEKVDDLFRFIKKHKLLPQKYIDKIKVGPKDINKKIRRGSILDMTTDADVAVLEMIKRTLRKNPDAKNNVAESLKSILYKGSFKDEISTQIDGILLIPTIAYTVIAANIFMPVLKNKLANKRYREELALIGETPESIRRKKRYDFKSPYYNSSTTVFSGMQIAKRAPRDRCIYNVLKINKPVKNSVFSKFYTKNYTTSKFKI